MSSAPVQQVSAGSTSTGGADVARDHDWILARAEEIKARGRTAPRAGRDPVNQPAINDWLDAIGDPDPRYRDTDEARALGGPVAPPAMAQVWTMYGLVAQRPEHDPLHNMMQVMDEAGFTSVLGTNCDQTYARHLRVGEQVEVRSELESVVGPKRTAMGEGYFVTSKSIWYVGDEEVATMLFRVLKFKPKPKPEPSDLGNVLRPVRNRDNDFFFEGTALAEVRLQRCSACGLLRHPPGPLCPSCHTPAQPAGSSEGPAYVVASGRGHVHSFLVHHAPRIPGRALPLTIVLVDLDEGVRMVGVLHEPDGVSIGDRVEVVFDRVQDGIDDGLTLAAWRRLPEGEDS